MLTFTLYTAEDYERRRREVHIDPAAVVSVEEAERRPAFAGYWQVAVIALATGQTFTVQDGARTAARQIAEAKLAAADAEQERLQRILGGEVRLTQGDGTDRLLTVLYGESSARTIGGSRAPMLWDAAAEIERLRGLIERSGARPA